MFIAQVLVGPSKQLKQIIQIEHNIVKNPNRPKANQLAIYKRVRGFELRATVKQIQAVVRAGLEPGTAGLQVRHADHSTTLPPVNRKSQSAKSFVHESQPVKRSKFIFLEILFLMRLLFAVCFSVALLMALNLAPVTRLTSVQPLRLWKRNWKRLSRLLPRQINLD